MTPQIKAFFDAETSTLTYVVFDPITKDTVVLDPVWNYDSASSKLTTKSVDEVTAFVTENQLHVHFLMETHAHADHISGAQVLKKAFPHAKVVIGKRICDVQKQFGPLYNLQAPFAADGHQFDTLLNDQETIQAGSLAIKIIFTPGHTPACASYCIGDAVFTGDALFVPDFGTGRCDFPLGSASDLFDSVHDRLYKLPDNTRTFTGHDYQPGGRPLAYESTIGEQKRSNIHIKSSTLKEEFVAFRTKRDATLAVPRLLLASVQVNICAGHLPSPESNRTSYLKLPLTLCGLLFTCFATEMGCTRTNSDTNTIVVVAPPPTADAALSFGKKLYTGKACSTCHSADGSPGVGPTFKGLYGKMVELKGGGKVLADDAYIRESITDPNAKISKGFPALMPKLSFKEDELAALVAFIKSLGEAEKATQK